jgi:dihydroneopterin aldolase
MNQSESILQVKGLRFFAFHGFHTEEQKCGGWFEVDVEIRLGISDSINDELESTINYEGISNIAKSHMKTPKKTIEEVAFSIKKNYLTQFQLNPNQINVTVRKLRPAILGISSTTEFTA